MCEPSAEIPLPPRPAIPSKSALAVSWRRLGHLLTCPSAAIVPDGMSHAYRSLPSSVSPLTSCWVVVKNAREPSDADPTEVTGASALQTPPGSPASRVHWEADISIVVVPPTRARNGL